MSIILTHNYDFLVRGLRNVRKINTENIKHILNLENLGDQNTDNQVIVKKLIDHYSKLDFSILDNDNILLSKTFSILDRKVPPVQRDWRAQKEGVTIKICPGTGDFFEGKWVLNENGTITAVTTTDLNTAPWDATWMVMPNHYEGATDILCKKTTQALWVVSSLDDIVTDSDTVTAWEFV